MTEKTIQVLPLIHELMTILRSSPLNDRVLRRRELSQVLQVTHSNSYQIVRMDNRWRVIIIHGQYRQEVTYYFSASTQPGDRAYFEKIVEQFAQKNSLPRRTNGQVKNPLIWQPNNPEEALRRLALVFQDRPKANPALRAIEQALLSLAKGEFDQALEMATSAAAAIEQASPAKKLAHHPRNGQAQPTIENAVSLKEFITAKEKELRIKLETARTELAEAQQARQAAEAKENHAQARLNAVEEEYNHFAYTRDFLTTLPQQKSEAPNHSTETPEAQKRRRSSSIHPKKPQRSAQLGTPLNEAEQRVQRERARQYPFYYLYRDEVAINNARTNWNSTRYKAGLFYKQSTMADVAEFAATCPADKPLTDHLVPFIHNLIPSEHRAKWPGQGIKATAMAISRGCFGRFWDGKTWDWEAYALYVSTLPDLPSST